MISFFIKLVVGVAKRKRSSSRSHSRSRKKQKGMIPGVWHGVKKPKKMNKNAPKPKPVVSPKTRQNKIDPENKKESTEAKKRIFASKPRNRTAGKNDASASSIFGKFNFLNILRRVRL